LDDLVLQALDRELQELLLLAKTDLPENPLRLFSEQECPDDFRVLRLENKVAQDDEVDVFVPEELLVPQEVKHNGVICYHAQDEGEQLRPLLQECIFVFIIFPVRCSIRRFLVLCSGNLEGVAKEVVEMLRRGEAEYVFDDFCLPVINRKNQRVPSVSANSLAGAEMLHEA
jgi:hypothetical protein